MLLVYHARVDRDRPEVVLPVIYDDEAEHERLLALLARYEHEDLSPAVDRAITALAYERARRAPLRTFVGPAVLRMVRLWTPPARLAMPASLRPLVRVLELAWLPLPFLGGVWLLRGNRRARFASLLIRRSSGALKHERLVLRHTDVDSQDRARVLRHTHPADEHGGLVQRDGPGRLDSWIAHLRNCGGPPVSAMSWAGVSRSCSTCSSSTSTRTRSAPSACK